MNVDTQENRYLGRIRNGVDRTFQKLETWTCLKAADLREFRYYHRLMRTSLESIAEKAARGTLRLLDLKGFPQIAAFPGYHIKAGVFIGSFDPFQMTHLTMALRFLASADSNADVVFVIPEGAPTKQKPDRSDYSFRFEVLRLQTADVFRPLIVPLDIGRDADTVEIVRRFISLFPGSRMTISHLMGTDSLPLVKKYGRLDREIWETQANRDQVKLDYRIFALPRGSDSVAGAMISRPSTSGFPVFVDREPICTPSSTDLRRRAVFTILFPSSAVLRRVEVLFRYSMNHPWTEPSELEYEI